MRPRDLIVSVFLERGHPLCAGELSAFVQAQQPGIGRATVYRTLRWMVDAGVAKKVDGLRGRTRYAQTMRRAPHFELLCHACHRTIEAGSSAIDALTAQVAAAHGFAPSQGPLLVHGTCGACRARSTDAGGSGETTHLVAARDVLRVVVATSVAAKSLFVTTAAAVTNARVRGAFHRLADEERERLARLEADQRSLVAGDPELETRPTVCFFKGSATALYSASIQEVTPAMDARAALMAAIRCTRGSHRFFARSAERLEEPTARAILLAFSEGEQAHLDTLVHEYRALAGPRPRRVAPRSLPMPIAGRRLRGRP